MIHIVAEYNQNYNKEHEPLKKQLSPNDYKNKTRKLSCKMNFLNDY